MRYRLVKLSIIYSYFNMADGLDITPTQPLLLHGDCIEMMKTIPAGSVDLFICDLPYGETNCAWDTQIDLGAFWKEFKRIRKSKRTACIHFCSTGFGYTLIKSWERGYKMDMVWKKRNKTGGLQSRYRPMRNHEMVYFFYEQAPKYNRDKYHKRVKQVSEVEAKGTSEEASVYGATKEEKGWWSHNSFKGNENPASVLEEAGSQKRGTSKMGSSVAQKYSKEEMKAHAQANGGFDTPTPSSVIEEEADSIYPELRNERHERYLKAGTGMHEPPCPGSVYDGGPTGKRVHPTQKPEDILTFFLKYYSDEGDVVCDPTMGSGSVGVVSKKMGRSFIGIELTEKYYEIAKERITTTQPLAKVE